MVKRHISNTFSQHPCNIRYQTTRNNHIQSKQRVLCAIRYDVPMTVAGSIQRPLHRWKMHSHAALGPQLHNILLRRVRHLSCAPCACDAAFNLFTRAIVCEIVMRLTRSAKYYIWYIEMHHVFPVGRPVI